MSMNWTQYLLGKLAEEAAEVAKEALKNQQQGVASLWKGRSAIFEVRKEFYEMIAICQMLDQQDDVGEAMGARKYLCPPVQNLTEAELQDIITDKIGRVYYYAVSAYASGNLTLTVTEFEGMLAAVIKYGAKHDLPYPGNINFRQ